MAVTVVAMLAVLKAGAAYVPLGTDLPDDRLSLLLMVKLNAQIVLCTTNQESKLNRFPIKAICCDIGSLRDDCHRRSS